MREDHKQVEQLREVLNHTESKGGFSVWFSKVASETARWCGSPSAFILACLTVIIWGVLGPLYHYSDTWQLVINTGTTVLTYLIVFLIQNTQNRDAKAIHLKLDEIIRSHNPARNEMIDIEKLSDAELEEVAKHYERIRKECDARRQKLEKQKAPAA